MVRECPANTRRRTNADLMVGQRRSLLGGSLPMSLPAGRFWAPLDGWFSEKYMFLPFQWWDIVSMLCPWTRHFSLTYFTWFRCKWVPGRTDMTICAINSMGRNGCRTVCSPWSWNRTATNRFSDQEVQCEVDWWVLSTWYQTIGAYNPAPFTFHIVI